MEPDQQREVQAPLAPAEMIPALPDAGEWSPSRDDAGAILINRAALRAWLDGQPYAGERDTAAPR